MAFKIEWTDNAKENIRDIASHLLDNWSFEVAEKFTDNLIEQTVRLEKCHFLGKTFRIRGCEKITYFSSQYSVLHNF